MRENLFTVLPTLGPMESIDFNFEDGSSVHLEGNALKQWMLSYTVVSNLVVSTSMTPQKQEGTDTKYTGIQKVFGNKE